MTRKILLTVAVSFALLVVLAGMLAMATWGPVFAVIGMAGMVVNGFAASDVIGKIWKLDGQYTTEE